MVLGFNFDDSDDDTSVPTNLPRLYSRRADGKIQQWNIEVDGNKYRVISGITDGQKVTSGWVTCDGKNLGKKNATTGREQAEKEALAEWKKQVKSGYKEDINEIDVEDFFSPMLAEKYKDYEDDIKFPVYTQPKLDGMRLIVRKEGMFSRNGNAIISVPHIRQILDPLFKYNPKYIFDGECYADKLFNDFNKIMSLSKKSKPTVEDLKESESLVEYHIYDFPFWDGKFSERFNELKKVLSHISSPKIKLVETHLINNKAELDKYYEEWLEAGYEGQMVRLDVPYENKRTSALLKRKEFQDSEFEVVDIEEGTGNRAGMAGNLKIKDSKGKIHGCNIRGGFKFYKELLANRDKYIGKIATVTYFTLTPDGAPKFPYFKCFRKDGD